MADNNKTNRKRKSDSLLSETTNDESNSENQQDEGEAEPLAKHPKTSDKINLKIDSTEITETADDTTATADNSVAIQNDDNCEDANIPIEPIITIKFSNEAIAEKYQQKFLTFLSKFAELKHAQSETAIHVMEFDEDSSKRAAAAIKSKAKKGLFLVDTAGKGKIFAPKYSSKFKVNDDVDEEPMGNLCFNCDGNHNLRDCPEPKNMNKIRTARNKFNNNKPSNAKAVRYHVEEDQRFGHLKPGQPSDRLREALGLKKYDIPSYVYKMRCLGYPPGWLEDAKVEHSDLCVFDIEGKNVKKTYPKKARIDTEKIIEYPGFNVSMGYRCKDNCNLYGVPPFSDLCSKEAMISCILKMEDDEETCDMEIDDSDKDESLVLDSETGENKGRISPTLTDLEKKKMQLLAELTDQTSTNDSIPKLTIDDEAKQQTTDDKLNETAENDRVLDTPCKVKTSIFGTPIIKSASTFIRLPNMNNFMKDVSPVINFENLPNSTGKYEQMTGVLDKVRRTLKLMEKENS